MAFAWSALIFVGGVLVGATLAFLLLRKRALHSLQGHKNVSGESLSPECSLDESLRNDHIGDCKMVMLIRTDVTFTKGKACAQCGHAAVQACEVASKISPAHFAHWLHKGQAKIAVKASLEEILDAVKQAEIRGIPSGYIQDAGHTQVEPGTITVGFVGPYACEDIDLLTRKFKLY